MLRVFLILLSGILFFSCNQGDQAPESLADLQVRVNELNNMNTNLDQQRNDLFKLIRDFNNTRPENEQFDITAMDTLMGAPERTLLKAMFADEKDISYSGLLKTIVEKNEAIAELKDQITDLSNQLPRPYLVRRGDTHYEIILDYLITEKGMSKSDANKTATRTALIDDILPGNQVWLMYKDGIVGTYVTQGDAKISPMKFISLAKKRMLEKVKAVSVNETKEPNTAN